MRLGLASLVPLLALAACFEGSAADERFRAGIRNGGIETCRTNTRAAMVRAGTWSDGEAAHVDRLCECTVDFTMEGQSTPDLVRRANRDDRTPAERAEEDRYVYENCREPFERRHMTAAEKNRRPSQAMLRAMEHVQGLPRGACRADASGRAVCDQPAGNAASPAAR